MVNGLAEQTKNAFEFIEKLYLEVSYLIKEIEGLLGQEEEKFLIIRPTGYEVKTRTSTGLDTSNVKYWLSKDLTVFFCPEQYIEPKAGQTITEFNRELKIIVIHIKFAGRDIAEPRLIFGHIENIINKRKKDVKFENLTWVFAYNEEKIFRHIDVNKYEDNCCAFTKKLNEIPLYSINDSESVMKKIIEPVVNRYRE